MARHFILLLAVVPIALACSSRAVTAADTAPAPVVNATAPTVAPAPAPTRAAPGISLEYVLNTTGNNAGINSAVFVRNDSDVQQTVPYYVTVNSAAGKTYNRSVIVPAHQRVGVGNTCAFDVAGTTLCGSSITYELQ